MAENSEQIEYWNGQAGEIWVAAQERLDRMLDPLSDAALQRANAQPGERVIDVGCGCGTTSIALAGRGAAVWGIDISGPMLARARERSEGLDNLFFSETDASTQTFTQDHQLVFSRFGVMFFADPVSAFSNIRSGLMEQGRLVFLCWQAPAANPWISITGKAIQPFLPVPAEQPDPQAPGPFAFADDTYVQTILNSAGFADVSCDPLNAKLRLGGTLDEALEFQGQVGPVARVLAELDDAARSEALAAARTALAEYETADGVSLDAACWLVCANNR